MAFVSSKSLISPSYIESAIRMKILKAGRKKQGFALAIYLDALFLQQKCGLFVGDRVDVFWDKETKQGIIRKATAGRYKLSNYGNRTKNKVCHIRIAWVTGMPFLSDIDGCAVIECGDGYLRLSAPDSARFLMKKEIVPFLERETLDTSSRLDMETSTGSIPHKALPVDSSAVTYTSSPISPIELITRLVDLGRGDSEYVMDMFIDINFSQDKLGLSLGDRVHVRLWPGSRRGKIIKSASGGSRVIESEGGGCHKITFLYETGYPHFGKPTACRAYSIKSTEIAFDFFPKGDDLNDFMGLSSAQLDADGFFSSAEMKGSIRGRERSPCSARKPSIAFGMTFTRPKANRQTRYHIYLLVSQGILKDSDISPGDKVDVLWNKINKKGMIKKVTDGQSGWTVSLKRNSNKNDSCVIKITHMDGLPSIDRTRGCVNIKPARGGIVFDLPEGASFDKNLRKEREEASKEL